MDLKWMIVIIKYVNQIIQILLKNNDFLLIKFKYFHFYQVSL